MVKKTSSNIKAPVKSVSNIGALEAARDKGKQDHLLSQRTVEGYNRYVLRGKEFLKALIASKKAELETERSLSDEDRIKQHEELQELSKAFDPSPNTQSELWDKIDRYRSEYHIDEDTLKISGSPANAPSVGELRRSVVNRDKGKDVARNHAEATRNSETSTIKNRHYKRNCEGPDPYHILHDEVYLVNRKGRIRQSGNTSAATGRMYDQKDTPAIDMRFHVQR
ncbi:hypothetical protein QCA50_012653 [Cerrena zonata]|uniref:Uncharacterized protein n=1 Tax=Cerrena zonata TaxID=2478898 RepID=A0AAW0FY34_9APHY